MFNFKEFIQDEDKKEQVRQITEKIKEISQPTAIRQTIIDLGTKDIETLIRKLESDPRVRKVVNAYEQIKNTREHVQENFLSNMVSGSWHFLTSIAKWAFKSIGKTLTNLFVPFGQHDATIIDKINYAGTLLLTVGLSGTLLATGAPLAVAGAALPYSATWFGIMWFGKNILEPALLGTERMGFMV